MLLSQTQEEVNSIVSLSEHIFDLINDQNIVELEKKIPEYTQRIENHFLIQQQDLSRIDLVTLRYLISTHETITNLINNERVEISKKIKNLHLGKEMQNTYP